MLLSRHTDIKHINDMFSVFCSLEYIYSGPVYKCWGALERKLPSALEKWKATQHYGVHHHKCGRLLVLGNSLPHLNVVIPQKMLQCVHGQYSLLILFLYKSYLTFNLNSIYPSGPFLTIIMVVKSFFVSQNEVGNKKLVFHLLWPFSLPSEITTDHPIELWTFYISFSVWSHK